MPDILLQDLKDEIARRSVVLFAGEELSALLTHYSLGHLATRAGLLRHGIERCVALQIPLPARWTERQLEALETGDPAEVFTVAEQVRTRLRSASEGEYGRWLVESVGALRGDGVSVISAVHDLNLPIITTAYDGILEEGTGFEALTWKDGAAIERVLRGDAQGVIHIHGHYRWPETVVLGVRASIAVETNEHTQAVLRAVRMGRTLLFLGVDAEFDDPDLAAFLDWSRTAFAMSHYRHYRLVWRPGTKSRPATDRIHDLRCGNSLAEVAAFLRELAPAESQGVSEPRPTAPLVLDTGVLGQTDRNAHEDGPNGVIGRQLRSVPTRGSGSSPYVAGPPIERESNFVGRPFQINQIRRYLDLKQSMQLIGEHRMGRTSMLRWVEREARRQKLRVAALDAAGLSGRSPGALVVAIAEVLGDAGLLAKVRGIDRSDARQAEALLPTLVPSVVLIDNADELARSGHGFDKAFFDTWRSLGSEGFIWISTSRNCLFMLFKLTGLSSSFLNNAGKVWLGQLERGEALELARCGLEARMVELAVSEAAGFPYFLQWLCEALWREPAWSQKAVDRFRNEMEPIMDGWWKARTPVDRAALKLCADRIGTALLPADLRRRCVALAGIGLLDDSGEAFTLPGEAWRSFVSEAKV